MICQAPKLKVNGGYGVDSVVLLVVVLRLKETEGNQAVENLRRLMVVAKVVSEADDENGGGDEVVVIAVEVLAVEGPTMSWKYTASFLVSHGPHCF